MQCFISKAKLLKVETELKESYSLDILRVFGGEVPLRSNITKSSATWQRHLTKAANND